MKPSIALSALLAAVLFDSATVLAQNDLKPYFNVDGKGLWVEGYDPVAYLVDGKATEGSERFSMSHQGATFRFASQAHLEAFRKDPAKYLPQYGGYCAYAMGASGEKVEVDPETFKVREGKVYLFYNAYFNNTLTSWNKDEARLHQAADRNWAVFKHLK